MSLFCTGVEVSGEGERGREREREREHAGAGFLMILSNKGPIIKANKLMALLRRNKRRNTKSKSTLCHFGCWECVFVRHQTDPTRTSPCHTADPVHGGRFLPFGHLRYYIILLGKNPKTIHKRQRTGEIISALLDKG